MRRAAAIPVLVAALLAAVLPHPARADYYRLLDGDKEAAQVRVDLIRSAQASVSATYFIVGKDRVALAFLAELREAARRGVDVYLVVDAPYNAIPLAVRGALLRDGIQMREYHPFRLTKPRWFMRRLHDKLLVVDAHHLVTGGRNLEAAYFGMGEEDGGSDYVDRDAYVRGEAAARAASYFDALWNSRELRPARLARFNPEVLEAAGPRRRARIEREMDEASHLLDASRDSIEATGLVRDPVPMPLAFAAAPVGPVRFLHDRIGRKDADIGISAELLGLMDATRASMTLESPWLVPSRDLRRSLRRAVDRGVRVRILTNSLAVTDSLLTHAAYTLWRKRLLRRGVELWEYPGPGCLHSKTGVFDDTTVVVGSFNLDPRSEHLNTEVAVVVEDVGAATEALRPMERRLEGSVRLGQSGAPEAGSVRAPKAPLKRRLLLVVARLVAPFVHRQL